MVKRPIWFIIIITIIIITINIIIIIIIIILDRIQRRQLKWYGHFLRMEDSRWPKKIYQWTPHGRKRRGRPQ